MRAAALPYDPTTIASIGIKGPANVSRDKTSSGSAYQRHNESGGVVLVARAGTSVTVSQQTDGENILDDSDIAIIESGMSSLNMSRDAEKEEEAVQAARDTQCKHRPSQWSLAGHPYSL